VSLGQNVTVDVTIGSKCHCGRSELGRKVQAALPPSLSAWGNGVSVYWQPSRRMDLDSGVEIRSQPNTDPVIPDNVCDIIFILSRKLFLECLRNDCLPSTDCCYIFRLINHNKK
jgi:hypothetical protein